MAKSLQLLLIFFCSLVLDLSVPQCNGLSIYSTSSATSSLVSTRSPSLLYTNSTIHVDEIFTASKYDIVAQVWEVKTHFCTQYRMTGLHRTFHFKCNGVLFTEKYKSEQKLHIGQVGLPCIIVQERDCTEV